MKNNRNLQKINTKMFNRLFNFFKNIFHNKNENLLVESFEQDRQETKKKNDFKKDIKLNKDKYKIIFLKQKFDNRLIDVKQISMKDKIELLEMYKQEILEKRTKQQN